MSSELFRAQPEDPLVEADIAAHSPEGARVMLQEASCFVDGARQHGWAKASCPAFGGSSPPVGPGMCQWRTSGQLPGEGCCLRNSEMTAGQHL